MVPMHNLGEIVQSIASHKATLKVIISNGLCMNARPYIYT